MTAEWTETVDVNYSEITNTNLVHCCLIVSKSCATTMNMNTMMWWSGCSQITASVCVAP